MLAARVFWFLILSAALCLGARVWLFSAELSDLRSEEIYTYEQAFTIHAAPGEFHLTSFVPEASDRTRLLDETVESGPFSLDFESGPHGRQLRLQGRAFETGRTVRYRATVLGRAVSYDLDGDLQWHDLRGGDDSYLESTESIQANHPNVTELLTHLCGLGQSPTTAARSVPNSSGWQSALSEVGVGPTDALALIYDYCYNGIASAGFSGSTDALTALALGEASCGGKSRLMAAMCRTVGIPTRLMGGVILGDGERKRTSHVWLECRLAGEWVPFDPLNDHYGELPAHFLTLYHGDEALIRHSRGLAFDYSFASKLDRVPKIWLQETLSQQEGVPSSAGTTAHIPLLRRQQFSLIVLAPFALLFTVFCRQVVGIDSMGLFLPVLLGFSLSQTGLLVGGGQLALALFLGILLRATLGRLELLHVPRNAVVITLLLILFLLFSFGLERMGWIDGVGMVVLPLAALAMTVERYTLVSMDRGHNAAGMLLVQTFVLAAGCYVVITTSFFKLLVVTYPEMFLVVIGLIIMVGQYRGLRLREQWRFRSVREVRA